MPGSDTGALEASLWNLLGLRGVDVLAWENFGKDWVIDVVDELKIKNINVFEADYGDLPNLSKVNFNNDDLKLIDDKAKKIISEFLGKVNQVTHFKKENLEPMINDLIKTHETNFKGVGQPLRIALTGSKFGPGIYDIIISLGKEEVTKRLENKIFS